MSATVIPSADWIESDGDVWKIYLVTGDGRAMTVYARDEAEAIDQVETYYDLLASLEPDRA